MDQEWQTYLAVLRGHYVEKGGPTSGFRGHKGVPGQRGGSAKRGGAAGISVQGTTHIGRYVSREEGRQDRRVGHAYAFESKVVPPIGFRGIYNDLKYMEGGPKEYENAEGISRSRTDVRNRMVWARDAGLLEKTREGYKLTPLGQAISDKGISNYHDHIALMTGDISLMTTNRPSPEAFSYWLYANWPRNTSRVRIGEIGHEWNKVTQGRWGDVSGAIVRGEQSTVRGRPAMVWERVADLNQVGINPGLNREDFI